MIIKMDTFGAGVAIRVTTNLQVVRFLLLFYPVECLLLWVNTKGISTGLGGQYAVLNGQLIGWQSLRGPPTDLHIVSKKGVNLKRLSQRNLLGQHILLPLLSQHAAPEVPAERPEVTHERRSQQAVAKETHSLSFQLFEILRPPKYKDVYTSAFQIMYKCGDILGTTPKVTAKLKKSESWCLICLKQ